MSEEQQGKLLEAIAVYPSFSEYLLAVGTEAADHYTQKLEGEKDEAKRIQLLNDRVKAETIIRLAR